MRLRFWVSFVALIFIGCTSQKSLPATHLKSGPHSYPPQIAPAAQTALAAYPELKNTPIQFIYKSQFRNSFMLARPRRRGIFKPIDERGYIIQMTRGLILDGDTILVENLPEKALTGWLGHELGHVMDYKDRTGINLVSFGLNYFISDKFKIKAERRADEIAVAHGFQDEIIATKNFILQNASIPKSYKRRIRRLYLSPEAVMEKVEEKEEE